MMIDASRGPIPGGSSRRLIFTAVGDPINVDNGYVLLVRRHGYEGPELAGLRDRQSLDCGLLFNCLVSQPLERGIGEFAGGMRVRGPLPFFHFFDYEWVRSWLRCYTEEKGNESQVKKTLKNLSFQEVSVYECGVHQVSSSDVKGLRVNFTHTSLKLSEILGQTFSVGGSDAHGAVTNGILLPLHDVGKYSLLIVPTLVVNGFRKEWAIEGLVSLNPSASLTVDRAHILVRHAEKGEQLVVFRVDQNRGGPKCSAPIGNVSLRGVTVKEILSKQPPYEPPEWCGMQIYDYGYMSVAMIPTEYGLVPITVRNHDDYSIKPPRNARWVCPPGSTLLCGQHDEFLSQGIPTVCASLWATKALWMTESARHVVGALELASSLGPLLLFVYACANQPRSETILEMIILTAPLIAETTWRCLHALFLTRGIQGPILWHQVIRDILAVLAPRFASNTEVWPVAQASYHTKYGIQVFVAVVQIFLCAASESANAVPKFIALCFGVLFTAMLLVFLLQVAAEGLGNSNKHSVVFLRLRFVFCLLAAPISLLVLTMCGPSAYSSWIAVSQAGTALINFFEHAALAKTLMISGEGEKEVHPEHIVMSIGRKAYALGSFRLLLSREKYNSIKVKMLNGDTDLTPQFLKLACAVGFTMNTGDLACNRAELTLHNADGGSLLSSGSRWTWAGPFTWGAMPCRYGGDPQHAPPRNLQSEEGFTLCSTCNVGSIRVSLVTVTVCNKTYPILSQEMPFASWH